MPNQELLDRAVQAATTYGLNPALVQAVVEQESNWNPWVIRYEPAFFQKYIAPMKLSPTEGFARATSWGLMQIMGQTAIEFGYKGGPLTKLCVPEIGLDYGCRKLKRCWEDANFDDEAALQRYNGGANPAYASQVIARMKNYGGGSQ